MDTSITIQQALSTDAEAILTLQKLAYVSEAAIYNDYTIEPLMQTIEMVKEQFADHIFLKAVWEKTIVGSIRARLVDGTCYIGKLAVHPEFQNRGLGKQLLSSIELQFKQADRYELFTGSKSEKNLQLYSKLGYQMFKTVPIQVEHQLIYLAKQT